MKVNYVCPFAQSNGVARAAHDYCMALLEAGVDLTIIPIFSCDTDELEPHYQALADHAVPEWPKSGVNEIWVVHAMPSDVIDIQMYVPACLAKVCVTTWETSRLPSEFVDIIDEYFDLVIVPSHYTKTAFNEADADVEVKVLPHAIGPQWNVDRQWNWTASPYIFYSIGAWGERKNLLGLIKAYLTEFRADEDVRLVIKTNQIDDHAIEALKCGTNLEEFPMVIFETHWMSEADLLAFHQDCDCYVTATRGEGFGLGAFEACALGAPVIAPAYGGQTTFLDSYKGNNVEVRCFQTPAVWTQSLSVKTISMAGKLLELKAVESIAPKGVDGTQCWQEPDLFGLQNAMRSMFETRAGCDPNFDSFHGTVVANARKEFFAEYGYAEIGRRFRTLLEEL